MTLIIGIDFDNTIVCYDNIFYQVALEKKLIPPEISTAKDGVRNYLRAVGKEEAWTELQGYVYGSRMKDVSPFPGAIEFFIAAAKKGADIYIISHKTSYPYMGPAYDLHKAAYEWLEFQFPFDRLGLLWKKVFFEETKEEKLGRIADLNCSHFIDDLPEFLLEGGFPTRTEKLLFAPHLAPISQTEGFKAFRSWIEIGNYFGIY